MREIHHHPQVVLHEEDRHLPLLVDLADVAGHVLALLEVHPRGRLVEQEQLRLHRQRARHFHPLAHPVGQQRDGLEAVRLKLHEFDDLLAAAPVCDLLAPRLAQPRRAGEETRVHEVMAAEQHVLEHGERAEQAEVLEGARDAHPRDRHWSTAAQALAVEADRSLLRPVDAVQAVEDRGLARTVGTYDREELAGPHVERDVRERRDAAKAQRHVPHLEERRVGAHQALHRFLRR